MSLPPIFFHYFRYPLPYARALALQERIHQIQLLQRRSSSHKDILLLLQHRPVYTAGRRQTESDVHDEKLRLTNIGADFVRTARGGELTFHGPGQIVGYPLIDLSRSSPPMAIRDYICRLQKTMELYLSECHAIQHSPSEHTGVFLNPTTKIASIGVQARHRLTSHGFALNVTREPIAWFDQVIACGLADVHAGSVESAAKKRVEVDSEIAPLVSRFGRVFDREMVEMKVEEEGEVGEAIMEVLEDAREAGKWATEPTGLGSIDSSAHSS